MFRAPLVCWSTDFPKRARESAKKNNRDTYFLFPKLQKLNDCFTPEMIYALDDKISHIQIVQDKDTDSTPYKFRPLYRRIARKKLYYANIFFHKDVSEKDQFLSVQKLMQDITFCNNGTMSFKIFTDDLALQDFFPCFSTVGTEV